MIYKYLATIFKQSIDREITNLIVIKTLKSNEMENFKTKNNKILNDKIKFFQDIWGNEMYFDPMEDAIKQQKQKNIYKFPYLSIVCDAHYSEEGAKFYSKFVSKKIYE